MTTKRRSADRQRSVAEATPPRSPSPGTVAASPIAFAPGDVLAGRFRIEDFVARGGMGEVYRAWDLELDARVAVKSVRPEIAGEEQVIRRFQREIVLARRVTHPNVCRLFDLYRQPSPESAASEPGAVRPGAPGSLFLVMEYVAGETLAERLRRVGRLSTAEALPITRQIVAGLAAAHRAAVVHRDFKSSNVILGTAADGPELRVVITDFGLARGGRECDPSSLDAVALVGTSTYMAPEQVEGGAVTAAADLFALGVVLYEMVTGARPFEGDTALAVALKRLKEPPIPPRSRVDDLDPLWERAILRCLERDPERRFGRVEDVVAALETEPAAPAQPVALESAAPRPAARLRTGRRGLVSLLAVFALACLGAWLFFLRGRATPPAPPTTSAAESRVHLRRAVAVLSLRNLNGDARDAWLSTALADMLTTDLAAGGLLRTIPGEVVARARISLRLADGDSLAPDTLARVRGALGTDLVVLGSYLPFGDPPGRQLRVDLRVQDAQSREAVINLTESGDANNLPELVTRLAARLRSMLGVAPLTDAGAAGVRATLPADPEAARFYARGQARLRAFDPQAAKNLLLRALDADPRHALTYAALQQVWEALGYDSQAREAATRAFELSRGLPLEERLRIAGAYHRARGEYDKAIESFRVLREFYPDDVQYGLQLAWTCIEAGRAKDAVGALETLRRLPAPAGQQPDIDLAEAAAAQALSDFQRQLAAARRATVQGHALGAGLLVAEARYLEGWAELKLGRFAEAREAFDEARRRFAAAGNSSGQARALTSLGVVQRARGDLAEAQGSHEQALVLAREVGQRRVVASALFNIGVLLEIRGQLSEARRRYEEMVAIEREVGNRSGLQRGLIKLGDLLLADGRLGEARASYDSALEMGQQTGEQSLVAFSLTGLADVLRAQGDLVGAQRRYTEALELRTRLGERPMVALTRLALAGVALEQGRPEEAARGALAAQDELRAHKLADKQAEAALVVLRARLVLGDLPGARAALETARGLAEASERPSVRLGVAVGAARLALAAGQAETAAAELQRVLDEARRTRVPEIERDARLLLGRAEIAAGRVAAGCARLQQLRRDALGRGQVLVARDAQAPACAVTRPRSQKTGDGREALAMASGG